MDRELRILYVDDEADIRTIVEFALEDEGDFELELCDSGQDAINRAREFEPDMILLDVMMPGMDGPTTLQHLREIPELADTPVVFVTAKVQQHEVEHFKGLGAAHVIGKPFDPMSLATQIRDTWEHSVSARA